MLLCPTSRFRSSYPRGYDRDRVCKPYAGMVSGLDGSTGLLGRLPDTCRVADQNNTIEATRLQERVLSTLPDPEKQSLEGLAEDFVRHAGGVRASSPLYGRLLRGVADDPDLLALAGAARRGQPAGLPLLSAVHYLLRGGKPRPPLAAY